MQCLQSAMQAQLLAWLLHLPSKLSRDLHVAIWVGDCARWVIIHTQRGIMRPAESSLQYHMSSSQSGSSMHHAM
jgi:hypothetical protein